MSYSRRNSSLAIGSLPELTDFIIEEEDIRTIEFIENHAVVST